MLHVSNPNETSTSGESRPQFNTDIVIYDGECNFCVSQIQLLRRLDGKNRLDYVSLHDPTVYQLCPDLSFDELMSQMWLVTPTGERFAGADAVRYLTRRLPLLCPLAPLMNLPGTMPLWRWIYRFIAKHRYRLAGRNCNSGSCSKHMRN